MTKILLIEKLYKFSTINVDLPYIYTCMFLVSIKSNGLYITPSFLAFHIPLIFALQQSKISEYARCFNADFLHFNDKTKFHIADSQQVIAMVVVG